MRSGPDRKGDHLLSLPANTSSKCGGPNQDRRGGVWPQQQRQATSISVPSSNQASVVSCTKIWKQQIPTRLGRMPSVGVCAAKHFSCPRSSGAPVLTPFVADEVVARRQTALAGKGVLAPQAALFGPGFEHRSVQQAPAGPNASSEGEKKGCNGFVLPREALAAGRWPLAAGTDHAFVPLNMMPAIAGNAGPGGAGRA